MDTLLRLIPSEPPGSDETDPLPHLKDLLHRDLFLKISSLSNTEYRDTFLRPSVQNFLTR